MASKKKGISVSRLRRISMVILDVDGVLTDGRMIYGSDGTQYKCFDVYDGFGITRAIEKGLRIAVISRGCSEATSIRAEALGIKDVWQSARDKLAAFEELVARHDLKDSEVCFIGDDDFDLPLLARAGVSAAPVTAMPQVRKQVDYVCKAAGGRGAVREVLDLILRAQKRI